MIDTVEFRVHDIKRHLDLAEFLDRKHVQTGKSISMRAASDDDFTPLQKSLHKTYIMYHDTGNLHQVAHFNELKSSHYSIAYKIDYLRDFIAFNVSLPKYVYGTNIVLYNRAPSDKGFDYSKHSDIKRNLREAYKRLIHFFNRFFLSEFGELPVVWELVEINRIDLCYNQVFDTKADSLEYLTQLRKLRKKFARAGSNYSRDWQTSIMYKTDRYSMKVYHKGTEFKTNDSKKLRELNAAGANFDVEHYQKFADKILRYEMTFRNSYISYLFMSRLFRSECYLWQAGLKLWKTAKNKKADADNYMQFRAGLDPDEKNLIDYVNSFIHKTKSFYLAVDERRASFDEETPPGELQAFPGKRPRFYVPSLFGPDLFDELASAFVANLKEFKLSMKEDAHAVLQKLALRNAGIESVRKIAKGAGLKNSDSVVKGAGRKISPGKIRVLLGMLETSTFEEIAASGTFSERTWRNLRKDLAELGVTQTSLNEITVRSDFDLRAYWSELIPNSVKYKNLRF